MKKCFMFILGMLFLLAGCTSREVPEETAAVQLANPWVSYSTLPEAEAALGFALSMPEEIETFRAESFRVMNGQLLEVGYRDGDFAVTVRKQPGEGQDLSGVYEAFEKETAYQTGNSWIVGRSLGNGVLDLIDSGGYSWSVHAPQGYPGDSHAGFLNGVLGQSETWIREVDEAFNATVWEPGSGTRASDLSCFVSCIWGSPEEIDLAEFLRYCPLAEQLPDENTEEAQAVMAAMGENPFLVTPVWRYPREKVSGLLQKYTGITVEELLSWEGVLYLKEYDAFYNCTSDWGPGRFLCAGGERSGDRIILRGENGNGEGRTLTLREENGNYYLVSYLNHEP